MKIPGALSCVALLVVGASAQAIIVMPSGAYAAGSDFGKDGEAVGW